MIRLVFALYFLVSIVSASTETRGILSIEDNSVKSLTVGESYRFKLTLVPFEEQLVSKKSLEGKRFIEYFFINEVLSIRTSPNNYDAVEIIFDLTLTKGIELKPFYIWSLVDRNIPIDVPQLKVNDVSLVQKNFSLLRTPPISFKSKYRVYYGVGALLLAFLLAFALFKLNRRDSKKKKTSYKKLLVSVKEKKDLENLYFERHKIYEQIKDVQEKKKLEEFFNSYRNDQFSPQWGEVDVSPLLEKAKALGKEMDNGV